jgi:voltage-gated potassium channel
MVIEEIKVAAQSPLATSTVGSSRIHHEFGIMVLAIRGGDGKIRFNPRAEEPIHAGDYLIVMGEPSQMSKLEDLAGQAASVPY